MPFYRTAAAPILAVYQASEKFVKRAAQNADMTDEDDQQAKRAINLISPDVLRAVSKVYDLSDDINDYIFPIPRAVTANVPNGNGDRFTHEELARFSPRHRCMVYETFRNDPLHIEHAAENPKLARGFLPDVYYMTSNPDDMPVITVAAVDTTKDIPFANGVLDGTFDQFSMGCICDAVKCSYTKCGSPIAYTDEELCEHLLHHKMATFDGELIFEDCLGVEFQELSGVGEAADPMAVTQAILHYNARKKIAATVRVRPSLISTLLTPSDQKVVADYFRRNMGRLPEEMVHLANKLF